MNYKVKKLSFVKCIKNGLLFVITKLYYFVRVNDMFPCIHRKTMKSIGGITTILLVILGKST